jgi:hypothetical protein
MAFFLCAKFLRANFIGVSANQGCPRGATGNELPHVPGGKAVYLLSKQGGSALSMFFCRVARPRECRFCDVASTLAIGFSTTSMCGL